MNVYTSFCVEGLHRTLEGTTSEVFSYNFFTKTTTLLYIAVRRHWSASSLEAPSIDCYANLFHPQFMIWSTRAKFVYTNFRKLQMLDLSTTFPYNGLSKPDFFCKNHNFYITLQPIVQKTFDLLCFKGSTFIRIVRFCV